MKLNAMDDITFKGAGTLIITSPSGKGIVGKDDVTITDGTYEDKYLSIFALLTEEMHNLDG